MSVLSLSLCVYRDYDDPLMPAGVIEEEGITYSLKVYRRNSL